MGERSPLKKFSVPKGSLLSAFFFSGVWRRLGAFYCTKIKVEAAFHSKAATMKTCSPPVIEELMLTYQQVFAISRVSKGTGKRMLCCQV